ncbi:MAG TPA: SpoIIE family protein phosphatase [Methanothrix sp.]|nr:SpoIIE family protein phosphatase [Methanothrix sp.]
MSKISGINKLGFGLLVLVLLSGLMGIDPICAQSVLEVTGGSDVFSGENVSPVAAGTAEVVAAGVWIAPDGGGNLSSDVEETLLRLAGPSRILRIMVQEEEVSELGYIGTSDGVLVLWPDVTETLQLLAPFDFRERPWYLEAARAGETIWTKPYSDQTTGDPAITCATPIFAEGSLTGVVGMDVSLAEIDRDLANISTGYPFLLDGQGAMVMSPAVPEGFVWEEILAPGSLLDSKNSDLAELAEAMVRGERGTAYVRFENGGARIVYAPLPSIGWSLGVASGGEELTFAKASQYEQLFHRISSQTEILALETAEALKGPGLGTATPADGREGGADGNGSIWPIALAAAAVAVLLGGIAGYWGCRKASEPVFGAVAEGLQEVGKGDFDSRIEADGFVGMGPLGEAFEKMTRDLKGAITLLEERSREAGRFEKEEEVSLELKRFLMPERVPKVEGFEVATLTSTRGGECCHFYDGFEMEGAKAVVVMAEVSGQGLSAAMVAALTRSLIRSAARRVGDPAKALRETNLQLVENVRNGMVVSCFCGMLDLSSHALSYANAGHVPPFIVSSDGFVDTLIGGGISMGALDKIDLEMEGWMIDPGDVLVIYNDGLVEVENEIQERFGTENLITLVKENRERSAQEIIQELEEAIRTHAKGQKQASDPSAMIVKRSE